MTLAIIRGPQKVGGAVRAPPSKSYTHRAIVAALLSDGASAIMRPSRSDDCLTTIEAVRAYGARVEERGDGLIVEGAPSLLTPDDVVDCRGSASTIRFMTPVAAHASGISVLTGNASLRRRPMGPLLDSLRGLGVQCYSTRGDGRPPVVVFGGGLRGGRAEIPGDVSSQFISGLIFAGGRAKEGIEVSVRGPLESSPYVRMTIEVVSAHGALVEASEDLRRIGVRPSSYRAKDHIVPGDYSAASFLLAAAAITGGRARVENLRRHSNQGDEGILDVLRSMGARVEVADGSVEVEGGPLKAMDIDVADMPDVLPICAVLGCYARGATSITRARRVRIKESDRLATTRLELSKMGARVEELEDGLIVHGPAKLRGAVVDPHDDHRIAMACAIAALGAEGETRIQDADCVRKSYPNFFNDLSELGAEIDVR